MGINISLSSCHCASMKFMLLKIDCCKIKQTTSSLFSIAKLVTLTYTGAQSNVAFKYTIIMYIKVWLHFL